MDNGDIDSAEEEFPARIGGRKYRPVVANDRAVLEMSSMDPGSSSSSSTSAATFSDHQASLKKVKVGTQANMGTNLKEGSLPIHEEANGPQGESKLELFGFDSLVNILGLRSMTGEQVPAPSSPRDGEDVAITIGQPKPADLKMGTLMGVFVPCLQNILGIIYYIRFSWIVGMAGIGESLLLVSFCGLCTFLTGISLSAIATNGAMKGGGPYYLIGRALGPEVGVSIGLCFFLGNAVAGALYVLGAVETFLKAVPAAGIFRETITNVNVTAIERVESPSSHDLQVYGIVVTIILCFIVFGGVKMINRVAPAFLVAVLFSLLCIFIGIFLAKKDHPVVGITGLSSETFKENWSPGYQNTNDAGVPDPEGSVYWNFNALVGLFFPAVTGIMAGSNRSASLKDTQRSIPIGTLAATLTTTAMYLVSVLLFGAIATRKKLLADRLLTATIAWPFPVIIYVGIILSTLGAALQSLTGAPRLLAAIANDDILPILNYFRVADGSEPHIATLFTAFICIGCVVIGNLDLITPTVTMFFLLCYTGVNLSCFLLDLLDAPSWRPRWKFHHWSLSLLGASLCIVIMFLISWSFTIVSLALASLIYYYVSIKGKAGDWGDGFKSAYFQLALRSLRSLGANQVHPKNWYPIPLVFCRPWGKLPENVPCHPKLADFANCMKKKGRGMSIFFSILDGDYHECAEDAKAACKQLATYIDYKRCEGVAEIVVAPSMSEGFRGIVQTMGLGNLKPNIVVMRYPEIWRRENLIEIPATFVGIINDCIVANKAVVIVKGLDEWPNEYQKQYGSIDLYWIVRDGGLMLLLSQLLLTKESFESCKIQVFCIAEEGTDAEALKADVKKFLYDLRMHAEVIVITMKSLEGGSQQDESLEAFTGAQRRIAEYLAEMKAAAERDGTPLMADGKPVVVDEQQVQKFLYTTLKLNSTILRYSRMAAVVLVSLPPPQGSVTDLHAQLSFFKNLTRLFKKKLGDAEAKTFLGRAVYLINIGSNDYSIPFTTNSSVLQSISQEEFVDMVIGNLTIVIREIYKKGGRKFGFLSMPPLGCLPFTRALKAGNTGACLEGMTTLGKLHNKAFPKVLQKLERELNGFRYSIADAYTAYSERINNPSKYGFKEGKIACCGSGPYRGILSCGGKRSVKEYELCENASEYVFFDSAHLSERANQQVAELMWSGTSTVTGAYTLKALFEI